MENVGDSEMKVCNIEQAIWAIEKAAALHAQKIADRMVSERLREELIAYDKWVINREGMGGSGINVEQDVDIYLKSRDNE